MVKCGAKKKQEGGKCTRQVKGEKRCWQHQTGGNWPGTTTSLDNSTSWFGSTSVNQNQSTSWLGTTNVRQNHSSDWFGSNAGLDQTSSLSKQPSRWSSETSVSDPTELELERQLDSLGGHYQQKVKQLVDQKMAEIKQIDQQMEQRLVQMDQEYQRSIELINQRLREMYQDYGRLENQQEAETRQLNSLVNSDADQVAVESQRQKVNTLNRELEEAHRHVQGQVEVFTQRTKKMNQQRKRVIDDADNLKEKTKDQLKNQLRRMEDNFQDQTKRLIDQIDKIEEKKHRELEQNRLRENQRVIDEMRQRENDWRQTIVGQNKMVREADFIKMDRTLLREDLRPLSRNSFNNVMKNHVYLYFQRLMADSNSFAQRLNQIKKNRNIGYNAFRQSESGRRLLQMLREMESISNVGQSFKTLNQSPECQKNMMMDMSTQDFDYWLLQHQNILKPYQTVDSLGTARFVSDFNDRFVPSIQAGWEIANRSRCFREIK